MPKNPFGFSIRKKLWIVASFIIWQQMKLDDKEFELNWKTADKRGL